MLHRHILVVDNDVQAVKLITATLKPLGFTVVSAASGEDGLAKAKETSLSLILINLSAPKTDGLRICKALMSITDTPIILLTMREGKYDPRYKSQYGIVDFIRKPIAQSELAEKVGRYAPLTQGLPEVAEEETGTQDAFEITEEVPSAHELEESIASYTEDEEPLTSLEEEIDSSEEVEVAEEAEAISEEYPEEVAEAVEVIAEDDVADLVEEVEEASDRAESIAEEEEPPEWTFPEAKTEAATPEEDLRWPTAKEESSFRSEEEREPEWPFPGEESDEKASEWSAGDEETSAEEEATPEWSLPEEETAEAPTETDTSASEKTDWSLPSDKTDTPEKDIFKEEAAPPSSASGAEDFFEGDAGGSREEPVSFARDIEYTTEEKEYEIRPAALEKHKRRKSKSRLLVPLLTILLVFAISGGVYYFFIAGGKKMPQLFTSKPPAPMAEQATPPMPVEEEPPQIEREPVTPAQSDGRIYYVQFGAFRSVENAKNLQKEIKELGYDTFILEGKLKGQPLYLVLLSDKFTDKWNAFKQAKQIKNASNIGTSVHSE